MTRGLLRGLISIDRSTRSDLAASVWIKSSLLIVGYAAEHGSHVDNSSPLDAESFLSLGGFFQ